jgi:hypothetical protein
VHAQPVRGGIALPSFDVGARRWVANATPQPLHPLEGAAVSNFRGGGVVPMARLGGFGEHGSNLRL